MTVSSIMYLITLAKDFELTLLKNLFLFCLSAKENTMYFMSRKYLVMGAFKLQMFCSCSRPF